MREALCDLIAYHHRTKTRSNAVLRALKLLLEDVPQSLGPPGHGSQSASLVRRSDHVELTDICSADRKRRVVEGRRTSRGECRHRGRNGSRGHGRRGRAAALTRWRRSANDGHRVRPHARADVGSGTRPGVDGGARCSGGPLAPFASAERIL
jgi:hypothetical protein